MPGLRDENTVKKLPSSSDNVCIMKDNEHYPVREEHLGIVGRVIAGEVKQLW